MASSVQPEAIENSKQAEPGEEPKQAQASDAAKQQDPSDKPTQAGEKSKPPDAGIKPVQTEAGDKKETLKKAGKIAIYVVLVATALLLVKWKFFTPPTVPVAQVKRQDFTGEAQGTGTINVDVLATVGAKIPGRIQRMLVDEGDFVHSGQVVATLEDTDIRQMLQSAQDQLNAARMMEQSTLATERSAQATQEARRATEFQAGRAWEREKHLVATGAVSQEEADQYQERSLTATSAITAAEAEVGAAKAKVQVAHSEIAAREADVRLQQFNLSQTKIFTYVSGIVTDRPKRSGDAIVSGETVLTVADPKAILVEAYLDERLAGQIRAGQPAVVTLRGRTKEQIAGRVYRVRPQADPAAEEMTVEISFPLPAAELQIGQWADVYVAVSQTPNALVVPKTAVMSMGEGSVVLVADANNRVRQVKVESVASSLRSRVMAVTGNLKPGEWVLTEPMGIKDGQKIRQDRSPGTAESKSKSDNPAMKM
jgi:RND family efflux transporter MFP subunit